MATDQVSQFTDFLPKMGDIQVDWVSLFQKFIWVLIAVVFLGYLIRMAQHRYLIKQYEKVRGGYVLSYGRYTVTYDKMNNLEYLRPMFGKKRLPSFSGKYYQKVKGLPIFGIKRMLSVIQQNKNSFRPLIPPVQENVVLAEVGRESTLSWVFIEQLRLFKKKLNRDKLYHMLFVLAPMAVIIGALAFFIFTIFMQAKITSTAAEQITSAADLMRQVYGK